MLLARVNERGIVKVADFGLSRELIVRDYYRVESSGTTPVPVRWMAPECLEANVFSTLSDVVSFSCIYECRHVCVITDFLYNTFLGIVQLQ